MITSKDAFICTEELKVEQISMRKIAKSFYSKIAKYALNYFQLLQLSPRKMCVIAQNRQKKTIDKTNAEKKAIFSEHIESFGHGPQSKTKK